MKFKPEVKSISKHSILHTEKVSMCMVIAWYLRHGPNDQQKCLCLPKRHIPPSSRSGQAGDVKSGGAGDTAEAARCGVVGEGPRNGEGGEARYES